MRPSNCSKCGKPHPKVHGHHSDYSKPLDVIWLCPSCHMKLHRELRIVHCRICGDLIGITKGGNKKRKLCGKHNSKLRRHGDPEWKRTVLQCPHNHPVPSQCHKCRIARKPEWSSKFNAYCRNKEREFKRQIVLSLASILGLGYDSGTILLSLHKSTGRLSEIDRQAIELMKPGTVIGARAVASILWPDHKSWKEADWRGQTGHQIQRRAGALLTRLANQGYLNKQVVGSGMTRRVVYSRREGLEI